MSNQTNIINRLSLLLRERKNSPNSSSYTSQLFIEGTEKIIAKIKEESEELIAVSYTHLTLPTTLLV